MTNIKSLECDWCANEITHNENTKNSGLCDLCVKYTKPTLPDTVHGCDNYLECGNDAVNGTLCSECRSKNSPKVQSVATTTPKDMARFISGLKRALSVE